MVNVKLSKALSLLKENKLSEAKEYLLSMKEEDTQALSLLFKIYMHENDFKGAYEVINKLANLKPEDHDVVFTAIEFLELNQDYPSIVALLQKHMSFNASLDSLFNLGFYARKAGLAELSLDSFKRVSLNATSKAADIYLNEALVYSELLNDYEKAVALLLESIGVYPQNIDIRINLLNLYEQLGEREKAKSLVDQILKIDPNNLTSLYRLADLLDFSTEVPENYETLCLTALESNQADEYASCDIYYSLGKAFDEARDYQRAWHYYNKANLLDEKLLPAFDRKQQEHITSATLARKLQSKTPSIEHKVTPIIICGMFRSGSTLIEKVITSSGRIAMGGEVDFLHRHLFNLIGSNDFNDCVDKEEFRENYQALLSQFSKGASLITDKRPENYLYVDVIKSFYPNAKVIWTDRDIKDNALSAYFQRLGPNLNYATSLDNTVYHYEMMQQIKSKWENDYPGDIFTLNYDEFVNQPSAVINELYEFLGMSYENELNYFYKEPSRIQTASVWQVRKPIYKTSHKRYLNYKTWLEKSNVFSYFKSLF
jgi:tetratricopeptide (TPR) repeat protein